MTGGTSGRNGRIVDGRFELLERLGSGGMGTVWRARDLVLHREVALKEVRPADPALAVDDPEAAQVLRERVLREARALARLSHPHVVAIHHIVDEPPCPWLVMELLPGGGLQDRLDHGPLPPREAARIGRDVLAALRAAHDAGVCHRDVKPANVLLRADGSAVLTDFGIAALQGSMTLTATGDLIGSPEYIAPERIRGAEPIPASDFWSLGMLLYVTVEGVSPLRRPTTLATLAAVLDDPVPPPVRSGPLAPVLTALLVRDPAARPDAHRLDELLEQAVMDRGYVPTQPDSPRPLLAQVHSRQTVTSTPTGPADRVGWAPARTPGRGSLTAGSAAIAAVLVATGIWLTARASGGDDKADGPETARVTAPVAGGGAQHTERAPAPAQSRTRGQATPSLVPPRSAEPAPPPAGPAGTWIAQLHSEPVSTGTAARDRQLAIVRRQIPAAITLRSDDFASLNPGYWVFYVPGPFSNGNEAVNWCAAHGRTTKNQCVGRYVSHDEADRGAVCLPSLGAGTGRCARQ